MTQTLMFPELESRDTALTQVLDNAGRHWLDEVKEQVAALAGTDVTGEDIRLACQRRNVGPHHPNAWGAAINSLIRDGFLEPAGRYVPMRAEGSHGRKTQVYAVNPTHPGASQCQT